MLNDTLPSQIDIRKLVAKGARIQAKVPVSSVPRIHDLLINTLGFVDVDLHFYLDDQHIRKVDGKLHANVNAVCERCLEAVAITIDSLFVLGVVWSEDDSQRLPASIEPLIVGEELVDLTNIVSEELLLSFPIASNHEPGQCKSSISYVFADPGSNIVKSEKVAVERENPFDVLKQLKKSSNTTD